MSFASASMVTRNVAPIPSATGLPSTSVQEFSIRIPLKSRPLLGLISVPFQADLGTSLQQPSPLHHGSYRPARTLFVTTAPHRRVVETGALFGLQAH
jgi:hypothetical protein